MKEIKVTVAWIETKILLQGTPAKTRSRILGNDSVSDVQPGVRPSWSHSRSYGQTLKNNACQHNVCRSSFRNGLLKYAGWNEQ